MYYGEKFNSVTHLVGAALAMVGLGALLAVSIQHKDPAMIVSFSVFGLTLVLLYTMSTLYHSFHHPRLKRVFQKLDHVSIYLLIAGTYTPYTMVSLGNTKGYIMLAFEWGLATLGLILDLLLPKRMELLQVGIYLLMGWVCTLEFASLKASIPLPGIIWLTVGGVAYTVGITFYVLDNMKKLPHAHGIWHLFVLTGSICHFISIIMYVR